MPTQCVCDTLGLPYGSPTRAQDVHRATNARALRHALVHVYDVREALPLVDDQSQKVVWQISHVALQEGAGLVIRKLPTPMAQSQHVPVQRLLVGTQLLVRATLACCIRFVWDHGRHGA